jgi:hypothetical protein
MKILLRILIFLTLVLFIESKYELIFDRIEISGDNPADNDIGALHTLRIRKYNRST